MPYGGMSLEGLDGFFSALIAGPAVVMPSEYLPLVWGDAPDWDTVEQARTGLDNVMRFWNHIVWRLEQPIPDDPGPEGMALLPCVAFPEPEDPAGDDSFAGMPEDFPFGIVWANGFLHAVRMRVEEWDKWVGRNSELGADLGMIVDLAGEAADEPDPDGNEPLGLQERLQTWAMLPYILQQMNCQRQADMRPQTLRREAVPGRNDACPCGSGRKFKKCCGGAPALH